MKHNREDLLKNFREMIARGEPIIGGGAGTGLSAKCEEAGGIDLIVIYNSGRYRMAGRGSLAGLLAYGNANEIVMDMAKEVLPVVKHTLCLLELTVQTHSVSSINSLMISRRLALLGYKTSQPSG